jgi:hypothetical protein
VQLYTVSTSDILLVFFLACVKNFRNLPLRRRTAVRVTRSTKISDRRDATVEVRVEALGIPPLLRLTMILEVVRPVLGDPRGASYAASAWQSAVVCVAAM